MHNLTVAELNRGLEQGRFSSEELIQTFLARIDALGPQLNAYITITAETAIAHAKAADKQRQQHGHTSLLGIPIAHKDIFCTQGIKTSCGSKMLDNFISPYDATLITQFNQAGSILLGKTNMDEFAMGSSNETSFYGPVRNPWDTTCVPGGSSGGSAAVVAARLAPAATGTDTGGSIRQPAALCGITGLKPTYGRVSRYGMIAFASSLDQGGPMTQTAEDAALLLQVMAGFDARDSTSIQADVPDYSAHLNDSIKGLRIGLPSEFFAEGLDPAIEKVIQTAIKVYESLGATLHEIHLPRSPLAIPVYYVLACAECSSNLSRYDGVRFGHRCDNPKDLTDLYVRSRSEGFGNEVKRRIMMGTYALSAGYYDAYFNKAQQVRRLISEDFQQAFQSVDVILGPTSPTTAFKLGEKIDDPISMYLLDMYTSSTNLVGLPGISIPAGFVNQLPVGLQLIGNHLCEAQLLNVAHQFQQATDWHQQVPKDFV